MKKILIFTITLLLSLNVAKGANRGVPFIRNFPASEYKAHNRNFDIACDEHGTVYVANFEGLLYYDGSSWRKIHTPGVSRVTRLALGRDGRVWVGGYKVFGYTKPDEHGQLRLHTIVSDKDAGSFDEVDIIKVTQNRVYVHTVQGKSYFVRGDKQLVPLRTIPSDKLKENATDSISNIKVGSFNISLLNNEGLLFSDKTRQRIISQEDGLCSNSINFITYDKFHTLWGATERGIFAIEVPSPYSHLTETQGLQGDVYSLGRIGSTMYIGSLQGLYFINNGKLQKDSKINYACWQLLPQNSNELLAATSSGLWVVSPRGNRKLTDASTLSVLKDGKGGYFTGEIDAVYRVSASGKRTLLAKIEKVTHITALPGKLRVETIYGEVWNVDLNGTDKKECVRQTEDVMEPKLEVVDEMGRKWITDFEGKDVSLVTKTKDSPEIARWTRPLGSKIINTIYCTDKNSLWVGGDFGVINCDLTLIKDMKSMEEKEPLYIRQITTVEDSVLWGGYSADGQKPLSDVGKIELPSSMRNITIYFSTRSRSIFSPTLYRYRINKRQWSKWSEATVAHFNNVAYGPMSFEVQAQDVLGNISETARVSFFIELPIYLRWWALLIYIIIILTLVRMGVNYREKKLKRAKEELEEIVTKRTSELRERTSELSNALDDLQRTQADLVRMERTATAGKLTQGLIDRILNPINYINNFAKLTSGLAKDLKDDIEDEQENMSEDNYEDCEDILDMMTQNLGKIEEHGVNTTRTLRAMEAMLNTHIGNIRETDMKALVKQAVSVASEYHKEAISKCNIQMITELPDEDVKHEVDPDAIHNVLLALITNSVYAVTKKYQRAPYGAEVKVKLGNINMKHIDLHVADNGVGIEDTIIDKVFDPFFTTKTTGEAAGVGLYLAREIVQDHNGTISLKTEKDQYTEITINI